MLLAGHVSHAQMTKMTEEIDGSGQAVPKDRRQDRLKQALRENLKRRKVQARERSRMASGEADERAPPDDGAGGSRT